MTRTADEQRRGEPVLALAEQPTSRIASATSQTRPRVARADHAERRPCGRRGQRRARRGARRRSGCRAGRARRRRPPRSRAAASRRSGRPAARAPGGRGPRSAARAERPALPATALDPSIASVDKRKTRAEAPRTARRVRAGPQGRRGTRARSRPPRRRSSPPAPGPPAAALRPAGGTLGHLGFAASGRDSRDLAPKEQIAAQARRRPAPGGAAEYIRTGSRSGRRAASRIVARRLSLERRSNSPVLGVDRLELPGLRIDGGEASPSRAPRRRRRPSPPACAAGRRRRAAQRTRAA